MLALAAPLTAQAEVEVLPPDAPALIQTTGAHPFWSETRQAWVPARELRAGEELRTQSGVAATVASLARQPGSQPVFNLEVETEHVFFVGEAGVLVHNACTVGRNGALNKIKQDLGIPKNKHPTKVEHVDMTDQFGNKILGNDGKPITTREYHYNTPAGRQIVVQEHSAGHNWPDGGSEPAHFNVRPIEDTRHGTVPGTESHYYFNTPKPRP